MENLSYWQKQDKKLLFSDLSWNIPEQKTGIISVVGGNSQNFASAVRSSEYLSQNFPVSEVRTILPDTLRSKLPPLSNFIFTPSTESGSFAKSPDLASAQESSGLSLIIGDLSKNSETAIAISNLITKTTIPTIVTRDAVDLISPEASNLLERPELIFVASMVQLQKLFRAAYYPKVLLLSMPLLPVIETLHKFTISYPATILTFHEGQIIVASGGRVITTPIERTNYSPISLWSGTLASNIAIMNLYNPNKPLEATVSAITLQ